MKVETVPLSSIDVDRLVLMVERIVWRGGVDHSRWVFRSPRGDPLPMVYKIWNPGYVRAENVLTGIAHGLYTDTTVPGLRGIIMERGQCRGYVTGMGTRLRRASPGLAHALWHATRTSGHFTYQYRVSHTRMVDGRATLIDLEGVYPVRGYRETFAENVHFEDADYADLVGRLQTGDLSAEDIDQMVNCHLKRSCHRIKVRGWISRKASGALRRLRLATRQTFSDRRSAIIRSP